MYKQKDFGLHIVQRIETQQNNLLYDVQSWLIMIRQQVLKFQLTIVGEVIYSFSEGGGFTVALCLAESHICIHTWPEEGILTFDIYLCNYSQNNENTVRVIANTNLSYWQGELQHFQEIKR